LLCVLYLDANWSKMVTVKFLLGKLTGKVGIAISFVWSEPKDANSWEDIEAAERALQTRHGWFLNPIFGNGDYPDVLKAQLAEAADVQGLDRSLLPEFSEKEKRYNKGNLFKLGL